MMQARFPAPLGIASLLGAVALLSACASPSGDYPSLAVRDSERLSGTMDVAEPEPYVPAPPATATLARGDQLVEQARAAHARFLSAAPEARRRTAAARSAGSGSDAWPVAQISLADLIAKRGEVMVSLADLDRLYAETSNAGEAITPIAQQRETVSGLVEEESALIAELAAILAR